MNTENNLQEITEQALTIPVVMPHFLLKDMKPEDKENVIEFYKTVVWLPSMPKVEILTDKDFKSLKDTMCFARWMFSTSYNK